MISAALKIGRLGLTLLTKPLSCAARVQSSCISGIGNFLENRAATSSIGNFLKNRAAKFQDAFISRAQQDFRIAVRELKIPSCLEPKLEFTKLPGLGGRYNPKNHTVFINSHLPWYKRVFARLCGENIVRHELKHSQQALEIAASGLNHRLPRACQLNGKAADLAHRTFLSNSSKVAERVGLWSSSLDATTEVLRSKKAVITASEDLKTKLTDCYRFLFPVRVGPSAPQIMKTKYFGDLQLPSVGHIFAECLNRPQSKKSLVAALRDYWNANSAMRQAGRAYLDDIFEIEARQFERTGGLLRKFG